jgi:hypothetical protein
MISRTARRPSLTQMTDPPRRDKPLRSRVGGSTLRVALKDHRGIRKTDRQDDANLLISFKSVAPRSRRDWPGAIAMRFR